MPGGFTHPWVVFLGSLSPPERAYIREVLQALGREKYPKLVEPAAGSMAISLLARELGWPAAACDTSDVSLYSAVIGGTTMGQDLNELGVHVDGHPLELPDGPAWDQAARILMEQVILRTQTKQDARPSEYFDAMLLDFHQRRDEHEEMLAEKVKGIAERLKGFRYRSLDLVRHFEEVADDPQAIIVSNSPTYEAGYERFFDTGGRMTWAEPDYGIFDPEEGTRGLLEMMEGRPALAIILNEAEPGKAAGRPIYARDSAQSHHTYYVSNRPDEILGALSRNGGNGLRVVPKGGKDVRLNLPILPEDHELTADSTCTVQPVTPDEARYLKDLWVHGIQSSKAAMNFIVRLDGYVAGVAGFGHEPISRPMGGMTDASVVAGRLLIMYGFGPHLPRYPRLNRLMVRLCSNANTHALFRTPANTFILGQAVGMVTVQMTKHPEAKSMRGLMKKVKTMKDPDYPGRFRLFYNGDILEESWQESFRWWLKKEDEWLAKR